MLPRDHRLREEAAFRRVYGRGRSAANEIARAHVLRTRDGLRVGVAVGKKVGKAVARNRARRRLREAVREALPELSGGADIVLSGRSEALTAPWPQVVEGVRDLLRQTALLPRVEA